LRDGKGT
jgi:hypothetical protein